MRALSRAHRRSRAGLAAVFAVVILAQVPSGTVAVDPTPSSPLSNGATSISCDSSCLSTGAWTTLAQGIDTTSALGIGTIEQVAPGGATVMVNFGGRRIAVGGSWIGLPRLSYSLLNAGSLEPGSGTRRGQPVLISGGSPPALDGTSWPGALIRVNWWDGPSVVVAHAGSGLYDPALLVVGTLIEAEPDHITVRAGTNDITLATYTRRNTSWLLGTEMPLDYSVPLGYPTYQAERLTLGSPIYVYGEPDTDWQLNPQSYAEGQPRLARCTWSDGTACHWQATRIYTGPAGYGSDSTFPWWSSKPYAWTLHVVSYYSEVVGDVVRSSADHVIIQSYDRIVDCLPQDTADLPLVGTRVQATASHEIDAKSQLQACSFNYPDDPNAAFPGGKPPGSPSKHALSIALDRDANWESCGAQTGSHSPNELPAVERMTAGTETWCAPVASFPLRFTIDGGLKAPEQVTLALQLDPDDSADAPRYLEPLASDGTIAATVSRVVAPNALLPSWNVRVLSRPQSNLPRHVRVLATFADGTFAQADLELLLDKAAPPPTTLGGNRDLVMNAAVGTLGQADGIAVTNGSQQVDYNVNPNGLASGNFNYGQFTLIDNGTPTLADPLNAQFNPSITVMKAESNISWTYLFNRPSIEKDEQWWGTRFMFGQFIFDWLSGGLYSEAQGGAAAFGVQFSADVGVHFQLRDQDPLSAAPPGWGIGGDVDLSAGLSISLFPADNVVAKSIDAMSGSDSLLGSIASISRTTCKDTKRGPGINAVLVLGPACLGQLSPASMATVLGAVADHQPWIIPGRCFLAQWLVTKDPTNADQYLNVLGQCK